MACQPTANRPPDGFCVSKTLCGDQNGLNVGVLGQKHALQRGGQPVIGCRNEESQSNSSATRIPRQRVHFSQLKSRLKLLTANFTHEIPNFCVGRLSIACQAGVTASPALTANGCVPDEFYRKYLNLQDKMNKVANSLYTHLCNYSAKNWVTMIF